MNDMSDEELGTRFSALRNQDRGHEPQFHQVWHRAELRARAAPPSSAPTLRWIAAAAAIVFIAAFVVITHDARDNQPIVTTAPAISSWQSPTASLLGTPSRDLLAPPPLLSSVFDGVTQTALQSKAD